MWGFHSIGEVVSVSVVHCKVGFIQITFNYSIWSYSAVYLVVIFNTNSGNSGNSGNDDDNDDEIYYILRIVHLSI